MKSIRQCYRCKIPMEPGIALVNGVTGRLGDWDDGDFTGQTVSVDPKKVEIAKCLKCPNCGHSIEIN